VVLKDSVKDEAGLFLFLPRRPRHSKIHHEKLIIKGTITTVVLGNWFGNMVSDPHNQSYLLTIYQESGRCLVNS